jgi:hypothetical protein
MLSSQSWQDLKWVQMAYQQNDFMGKMWLEPEPFKLRMTLLRLTHIISTSNSQQEHVMKVCTEQWRKLQCRNCYRLDQNKEVFQCHNTARHDHLDC